jgi:hypothetical protein
MHADQAKVLAFVKQRIQSDIRANAARRSRDRADLEAAQFYRGGEDRHWSVWDGTSDNLVPRPTENSDAALPPWFMRATVNLFGTKVDGICSILNQSQPAQEIGPERDTEKDRAAAEIAEAALPQLYEEADYPTLRPQLHKLITLTHAAALHLYYDTDERHGMEDLPTLQCASCQQFYLPHEVPQGEPCPDCGAADGPTGVGDAYYPAGTPQAGLPVTAPFPKGKIAARLLPSFEFSIPRTARELHEERVPWIAGHGRMDVTELRRTWADTAPAALDALSTARTGRGAGGAHDSVQYADRLHGMSSPTNAGTLRGGDVSTTQQAGHIVWMVWADPTDDEDFYFPDGLYAVILESEAVLESGPLPFKDEKGRPFKNVLLRTYQGTPGSAWGKPPSDDMIPIQKQLNLTLALAFLILMNDAAPTTYLPDTVTLIDEQTGVPGSTVRFQSLRAGDKPIIAQGSGFPESVKWLIEFLVNQLDIVSKLNAVLMGGRPEGGDPTAFEVQVLQERGMAAFKEPLQQLVEFEKRMSRMLLRIARQSAWAPRFYSVAGENGEWKVEQFLGTDLDGSVSIQVDPATAWPQSVLLQNMRLDQALERQILNATDPEVQAEYLSMNDLSRFKKSMDDDRTQIARELEAWEQTPNPADIGQPDPLWNLPVHFFRKVQWLKTEAAEQCAAQRPQVYMAIRAQIQAIQMLMMPAAPAPAPGTPGGPPPDGSAIDHAVASGALTPARPKDAPPDGKALDQALQSGVLTPAAPQETRH